MIRKMLAPMTAVGLALTAGTASADEWTGTITEIDETAGNIVVTEKAARSAVSPGTPSTGSASTPACGAAWPRRGGPWPRHDAC